MARPIDPRQRRLHRTLYAGIALALVGGIVWMLSQETQTMGGTIPVAELAKNVGQDPYNIVVIDSRSPDRWRAGHIAWSINIPVGQLGRRLGELSSVKSRQVAVMDEDPKRASQAQQMLAQSGFQSVVIVAGGWAAWKDAGKPVQSTDESETPFSPKSM
jgi:rhodanese-related sulfurtransferase